MTLSRVSLEIRLALVGRRLMNSVIAASCSVENFWGNDTTKDLTKSSNLQLGNHVTVQLTEQKLLAGNKENSQKLDNCLKMITAFFITVLNCMFCLFLFI